MRGSFCRGGQRFKQADYDFIGVDRVVHSARDECNADSRFRGIPGAGCGMTGTNCGPWSQKEELQL